MKAIAVVAFFHLLNLNVFWGYNVRRSAEPSLTNENDPSKSLVTAGIPEDDPELQKALQDVMRQIDQKLERTPNGTKTTQKLKLFFPPPSADVSASNESFGETANDLNGNWDNTASEETIEDGNIKSSHQHPALGASHEKLENYRSNDAGTVVQNDSHAAGDKVDMKVELTINISGNDQHQHFHPGNQSAAKNVSLELTKPGEIGPTMIKTKENPKENDSVLNVAAGNLNLNIKLMTRNHTSTTEHASENITRLEKLGGARSLNSNQNFDNSTILKERMNKIRKARKDVNNKDYILSEILKHQTRRKDESREVIEESQTTYKPSTTETPQNENKTIVHNNSLSDSLKAIIQNLTQHYANQNGGYPQDGETFVRNISKFLPGNGGTPEEQNYLQHLRQYLSRPNIFKLFGFPKEETLTEFEVFLEILKKLRRSKLIKQSGFYPIISEYLNIFDVLNSEYSSEEESWSLLDYLFDEDVKDMLTSQRDDSPESESDEWDPL